MQPLVPILVSVGLIGTTRVASGGPGLRPCGLAQWWLPQGMLGMCLIIHRCSLCISLLLIVLSFPKYIYLKFCDQRAKKNKNKIKQDIKMKKIGEEVGMSRSFLLEKFTRCSHNCLRKLPPSSLLLPAVHLGSDPGWHSQFKAPSPKGRKNSFELKLTVFS